MIAVGTPNTKFLYETTLELLQYVSVAMVTAVSYHDAFAGDSNTCVLFCEKCQQQFGRHGNIFQVMLEASLSILYHHGLEVCDFESDVNNDDDLEESQYMKSLPMHAMPSGLGSHSLSIIKTLDSMELQRCKYGMGSTLSH